MKETRKPGRPPKRTTKECREAIISLTKYWAGINRKFTINQVAMSVFGYHGGDSAGLIRDILESNGVEYAKSKAGRKPNAKPKPAICTHFVVTTDMHI